MTQLNKNITVLDPQRKQHTKASEEYLSVRFQYETEEWQGWVPVVYRRTGLSIPSEDQDSLHEHLNTIYEQMHPSKYEDWLCEQEKFWQTKKAPETKKIFELLKDGEWHCRKCGIDNPNFARRVQDLKEMGYTLSTHINYHCPECGDFKSTRLLMLPIDRVENAGNGYETWSPQLKKRILKLLQYIDVYENSKNRYVLPDHKFSEIRWDENTKSINPDNMTDEEIKAKFQLLTNQRNQQKREVCRNCYQTNQRGTIFGIEYYYEGGKFWDEDIPRTGKIAERGCVGCPWYDIERWRNELQKKLEE